MRESAIASVPSVQVVAMEQLRVVGLALRREGLLLCGGFLAFLLMAAFVESFQGEMPLDVDPADLGYLGLLAGLVAPLGVWKGERFFGDSTLWIVPVDHGRHARLKIGAGWVWLMGVVAFGYLAILGAVNLAGGTVGADETRFLIADPALARSWVSGPLPSAPWSTQLWQWMIPFTAATAAYLAASAFLIGLRRPVVWGVGCWLGALAVGGLAEEGRVPWVSVAVDRVFYLVDLLGSGGSEVARVSVLVDGAWVRAWAGLPTAGSWAAATAA
jgi:hypothetical protein